MLKRGQEEIHWHYIFDDVHGREPWNPNRLPSNPSPSVSVPVRTSSGCFDVVLSGGLQYSISIENNRVQKVLSPEEQKKCLVRSYPLLLISSTYLFSLSVSQNSFLAKHSYHFAVNSLQITTNHLIWKLSYHWIFNNRCLSLTVSPRSLITRPVQFVCCYRWIKLSWLKINHLMWIGSIGTALNTVVVYVR